MPAYIDMTGWLMKEHGVEDSKLFVIKRIENRITSGGYKIHQWLCRCECGKELIVDSKSLRNGNTKSCGCIRAKYLNSKRKEFNKYTIVNDTVQIHISKDNQDFITLISIEDLEKVKNRHLYLRSDGYVAFKNNKKNILLHRYILNLKHNEADEVVDHINRNRLDNRRDNLRIVNCSVNAINSKLSTRNTSGHKGITWDKSRGKWKATLNVNHKCYYIGRFDDLNEAIKSRKVYEKLYHEPVCS